MCCAHGRPKHLIVQRKSPTESSKTALEGKGAKSGHIAQVGTEKAQRLKAVEISGILGAVRTARCHPMSTGEGVRRGRTVYRI